MEDQDSESALPGGQVQARVNVDLKNIHLVFEEATQKSYQRDNYKIWGDGLSEGRWILVSKRSWWSCQGSFLWDELLRDFHQRNNRRR